jgi:hypothetical protein
MSHGDIGVGLVLLYPHAEPDNTGGYHLRDPNSGVNSLMVASTLAYGLYSRLDELSKHVYHVSSKSESTRAGKDIVGSNWPSRRCRFSRENR